MTVSLSDISLQFGAAGPKVLDALNWEVGKGDCVAITGRSGAGKTSLLNVIAGLLTPNSGEVRVDGRLMDSNSSDQRARVRRQAIGLVFQHFNLLPTLTVAENLAFVQTLAGQSADLPRITGLLDQVGLQGFGNRMPETLSGGESQRIAVARALAHRPPLVLADEPTANLDRDNAVQVMNLLVNSCRQQGASLVLISHVAELPEALDARYALDQGRLVQQ